MKKINVARWGSIIALGCLTVIFTQCIATPNKSSKGLDSNHIEVSNAGGLHVQDEEAPSVGVKDAERIFATMGFLTGVDVMTNNNVRSVFNTQKPQLPSNSRLESLTENQMVSVTKLAAEFCNELINDTNLSNAIWATTPFNFTTGYNGVRAFSTDEKRGVFVSALLIKFWGEDVQDLAVYEESYEVINDLILDMADTNVPPANNNNITRNTAKAACTVALSSAPVWMN